MVLLLKIVAAPNGEGSEGAAGQGFGAGNYQQGEYALAMCLGWYLQAGKQPNSTWPTKKPLSPAEEGATTKTKMQTAHSAIYYLVLTLKCNPFKTNYHHALMHSAN